MKFTSFLYILSYHFATKGIYVKFCLKCQFIEYVARKRALAPTLAKIFSLSTSSHNRNTHNPCCLHSAVISSQFCQNWRESAALKNKEKHSCILLEILFILFVKTETTAHQQQEGVCNNLQPQPGTQHICYKKTTVLLFMTVVTKEYFQICR